MVVLAIHTIFGYTWDELASIFGIMSIICGFIWWVTMEACKRNNESRKQNFYIPMTKVQKSLTELAHAFHLHTELSAKKLVHMNDRDNSFDKRLTHLEKVTAIIIEKLR